MKAVLSAVERDLVVAALAQDGRETGAFESYLAKTDFAGPVDGGHYRIFPLLYANLARAGVPAERLARFRGVYRHSWCKSQEISARAAEAARALNAAGLEPLFSKGVVLGRRYYDSAALRPMSDADLVVPVGGIRTAARVLRTLGYESKTDLIALSQAALEDLVAKRHSTGFRRGGDEIDLHWYLMNACRMSAANRRFWSNSEPFEIEKGTTARQLRPDDMLLHVVVHGLQWNVMSPLRWIPDAAMILRREGASIDWDGLFAAAAAFKLEAHFREGLEFLRALDIAPIPQWRRRARMSLTERVERWAYGKTGAASIAAAFVRLSNSDGRTRIPKLAGRWALRRIGAI